VGGESIYGCSRVVYHSKNVSLCPQQNTLVIVNSVPILTCTTVHWALVSYEYPVKNILFGKERATQNVLPCMTFCITVFNQPT